MKIIVWIVPVKIHAINNNNITIDKYLKEK